MALAGTQNIEKVKALRGFAENLRGAVDRWAEKYSDRKHYDKQGFGFIYEDGRGCSAFTIPKLAFEAYTGTYGCSSVGRSWSVDSDLAKLYFTKALNQHKQTIFDSMAALAEAEAVSLSDAAAAELEGLRRLLAEATADVAEQAAA
jgi:hypothetical protein